VSEGSRGRFIGSAKDRKSDRIAAPHFLSLDSIIVITSSPVTPSSRSSCRATRPAERGAPLGNVIGPRTLDYLNLCTTLQERSISVIKRCQSSLCIQDLISGVGVGLGNLFQRSIDRKLVAKSPATSPQIIPRVMATQHHEAATSSSTQSDLRPLSAFRT
jgi:hypothetical protein